MRGYDPCLAIAAFLDDENQPQGYGFLIDERYMVTCTHVYDSVPHENGTVRVEFPLIAEGIYVYPRIKIRTDAFNSNNYGGLHDISLLEITEDLPQKAGCVHLSRAEEWELSGKDVEIFGSSEKHTIGDWVDARAKRRIKSGRIQLNQRDKDIPIVQGFSGSMVWDPSGKRALGMISEVWKKTKDVEYSYMIPALEIQRLMDFLSPDEIDLICYRIDREKQLEGICEILDRSDNSGITTCVLHGNKNQGAEQFLRCLERFYWKEFIDTDPNTPAPLNVSIEWPKGWTNTKRIHSFLIDRIRNQIPGSENADRETLFRILKAQERPVIVSIWMTSHHLKKDEKGILKMFRTFWEQESGAEKKDGDGSFPVIACLSVSYMGETEERGFLRRLLFSGTSLKKTLEKMFPESILPELDDLDETDVLDWFKLEAVKKIIPSSKKRSGKKWIERLFNPNQKKGGVTFPMNDMAEKLSMYFFGTCGAPEGISQQKRKVYVYR